MGIKQIMSRQEAYYFLGIAESATEEEIKKAYRMRAKQYHPDSNKGNEKEAEAGGIKLEEGYKMMAKLLELE